MDAREQLLQAAVKVYSQSGVRGATTRRIAQEAGVNEVTLFRHFGSKDALLQEALAQKARSLFEVRLPDHPVDPAAELLAFARAHHAALWHHRQLIRVAMGELAEHPEATQMACQPAAELEVQLQAYLSTLRQRRLASGDWDAEAAASLLLGTLFADVMGRDCMPQCYRIDPDEAIASYVSLFLRAIAAEAPASVAARARS